MERDNILDVNEVMDESQGIRPRIHPKDGSGWVPNGHFIVRRENGARFLEVSYRDGVLHGPYVSVWPNGKVSTEGEYNESKQDGIWHFYNENGSIQAIIQFRDGKVIDDAQYIYDEDGTLSDIIHLHDFRKRGRESSQEKEESKEE